MQLCSLLTLQHLYILYVFHMWTLSHGGEWGGGAYTQHPDKVLGSLGRSWAAEEHVYQMPAHRGDSLGDPGIVMNGVNKLTESPAISTSAVHAVKLCFSIYESKFIINQVKICSEGHRLKQWFPTRLINTPGSTSVVIARRCLESLWRSWINLLKLKLRCYQKKKKNPHIESVTPEHMCCNSDCEN